MRRLVHTIASSAALLALAVCLWRGCALWGSLKRVGFAYFAVFLVSALLVYALDQLGIIGNLDTARATPQDDSPTSATDRTAED